MVKGGLVDDFKLVWLVGYRMNFIKNFIWVFDLVNNLFIGDVGNFN